MGLLDKLKKKILGPVATGKEPTTFDYFVDDVGAITKKVGKGIEKVLGKPRTKEELTTEFIAKGEEPQKAKMKAFAISTGERIDPFFASPLKKAGVNIVTKGLQKFKVPIRKVAKEIGDAGMEIIKTKGDGTIKVFKGEREILEKAKPLKSITENIFQNPIRVFEKAGDNVKELIYRPIKVAEKAAIDAKEFWNKNIDAVSKKLDKNSSKKIMKFALSLEDDGKRILQNMKETVEPLNDVEKNAYTFMRSRYNQLLNELNKGRAAINKKPIPKRKNYFTHITELGELQKLGFNLGTDDVSQLITNKVHRNSPYFRFAKERKGAGKVSLDAIQTFKNYQEMALDNIAMTPAIGKVRELVRTKLPNAEGEAYEMIKDNPTLYKYANEWLDFVAGQKPATQIPKVVDNLLNKLNQNVAFSTLAFNARSAMIQPSAIINSLNEVGPKATAAGIKELMMGGGEFALKKSNVLKGRKFETAIEDITSSMYGKTGKLRKKLGEAGVKPLQVLDNLTAQATWLSAYNKAKTKLGLSGKAAYNYADDIVTKTQASAAKSDVAKIQRSTVGKMATQFQTFVINDFNRLITDVLGVGNDKISKTKAVKKAATYITSVALWNALMEDGLGIPTPFPRPIKALKEGGVKEAAKELGGQLPVVGGAVRFGGSLGGPILDLGVAIKNKATGKYTNKSWWEIVGRAVGAPGVSQAKKTIRAVEGLKDGYKITLPDGTRTVIKVTDPLDKIRALLFGIYDTQAARKAREKSGEPESPKGIPTF